MIIGVPKEIKNNENRIALTPGGALELVKRGHTVYVQKGGGLGSGFSDEQYIKAGCKNASNYRRSVCHCRNDYEGERAHRIGVCLD
jgi:alanine dehydrogenase